MEWEDWDGTTFFRRTGSKSIEHDIRRPILRISGRELGWDILGCSRREDSEVRLRFGMTASRRVYCR